MRRGNMGHLTRIANAVVQNLEQGPVQTHISEVIRGVSAALPPSALCPQSDSYTGIGQTTQLSLSSSQGRLGVPFMKHRSVDCGSFSLPRTIHRSSAGLGSHERSAGSLVLTGFPELCLD